MDHCQTRCYRYIALILAVFALTFAAATASAQTDPSRVTFSWTAPTTGSAVDHYVVQHSLDAGAWVNVASVTLNSYVLDASAVGSHRIRVAGVDANGGQGLWSDPSDPYVTSPGLPGKPGKPQLAN